MRRSSLILVAVAMVAVAPVVPILTISRKRLVIPNILVTPIVTRRGDRC